MARNGERKGISEKKEKRQASQEVIDELMAGRGMSDGSCLDMEGK